MITILSFILVFSIIAITHEFGHFIAAKSSGIEVYDFALGIGPRIFSFKPGKTRYSLNLFPLGGYVRVAGIDPDNDEKETPETNKYYTKKPFAKFKTIIAGAFMNFILGFVIIYIVLLTAGIPKNISNTINKILPGSEAEKTGLKTGDVLISLLPSRGKEVKRIKEIIKTIHVSSNEAILLTVKRNNEILKFPVTPQYNSKMKIALVGFSLKPIYKKINPIVAIWIAIKETFGMILFLLAVLLKLFTGQISATQIAGPVGIARITGQYAKAGIISFLSFISFFSINVGVLNLLPLPALDGGRLIFIFIEIVRKKAVNIHKENKIHYWGMLFLLALISLITINDIIRIFWK